MNMILRVVGPMALCGGDPCGVTFRRGRRPAIADLEQAGSNRDYERDEEPELPGRGLTEWQASSPHLPAPRNTGGSGTTGSNRRTREKEEPDHIRKGTSLRPRGPAADTSPGRRRNGRRSWGRGCSCDLLGGHRGKTPGWSIQHVPHVMYIRSSVRRNQIYLQRDVFEATLTRGRSITGAPTGW